MCANRLLLTKMALGGTPDKHDAASIKSVGKAVLLTCVRVALSRDASFSVCTKCSKRGLKRESEFKKRCVRR